MFSSGVVPTIQSVHLVGRLVLAAADFSGQRWR